MGSQSRVHAGVPAGGEFGPAARAPGGVSLAPHDRSQDGAISSLEIAHRHRKEAADAAVRAVHDSAVAILAAVAKAEHPDATGIVVTRDYELDDAPVSFIGLQNRDGEIDTDPHFPESMGVAEDLNAGSLIWHGEFSTIDISGGTP